MIPGAMLNTRELYPPYGWLPPVDVVEMLVGACLNLPTDSGGPVLPCSNNADIPIDRLLSLFPVERAVDVLRTLHWLREQGFGVRTPDSYDRDGLVRIDNVGGLPRAVEHVRTLRRMAEEEKAMAITTQTERAGRLLDEAKSLLTTSVVDAQIKLQEALQITANGVAPVLHALAKSLQAQCHIVCGDRPRAIAVGAEALTELRAVPLSLEAAKLERVLMTALGTPVPVAHGSLAYVTDRDGNVVPLTTEMLGIETVKVGAVAADMPLAAAEREPNIMAEIGQKIAGAAMSTGTGVAESFTEGLKIAGSQAISDKIVKVVHDKLGHNLPIANTPLGQQVERLMFPALLHFIVDAMPAGKLPGAEMIKRNCMRAVTGVAKDDGTALINALLPILGEVAKMGTAEGGFDILTSMMGGATVEQVADRAIAPHSEIGALSEALARGLEQAAPGEEVEVKLVVKKNGKLAESVVPPFEANPTR